MGLNNLNINISSQVSLFSPPKSPVLVSKPVSKQKGAAPTFSLAGNVNLTPSSPTAVGISFANRPTRSPWTPGPPPPWGSSKDKLVPIADKSSPKNSRITDANSKESSALEVQVSKNENTKAPLTNQEISIDEKRIEPIAIFNLKTSDLKGSPFSPLQAAVVQSFLEDRISQEFASSIFERMLAIDSESFTQLDASISGQISDSQNVLSQLRVIFKILRLVSHSMSPQIEKKSISSIAVQIIDDLCKPEPLLVGSKRLIDPSSLVAFFGPDGKNAPLKSRTALVTQLLQIASQVIFRGYTPRVLGKDLLSVQPGLFSVSMEKSRFAPGLKSLSLQNNLVQSVIYGMFNETSYVGLDFYRKMLDPPDKRSLALTTMLANEYALSSGLGRLVETPLGSRFGVGSKNYVQTFLGVQEIQDASQETTQPDSLSDYFVIAPDGTSQTQEKNRILLLDNNDVLSTQENVKINSSFNEFMTSVTRDPLNNKMGLFDDALTRASTSMDSGLQFYKTLHLRDQKPILLTPRGLYTRLLDELSFPLSQLAVGKYGGKNLNIIELGVFRQIASLGRGSSRKSSPANIVKRYLLSLMAKKAALKLSGKDFQKFKTDAESGKKSQQSSTTLINVKEGAEKVGKTYTITTEQKDSNVTTDALNSIFSNDTIRFSSNDSILVGEKMEHAVPSEVIKALLNLSNLQTPVSTENEVILRILPVSFIEQIYESDSSLINRIVGIFIDMHEEAKKISKSENEDATWLNPARLTRNSQIDGSLSISVLFEAILDLTMMFVDSTTRRDLVGKFSVVAPVGSSSQNSTAFQAIRLLVQGSKANDFSQLYSGNKLIPDLDNRPASTVVTAQLYEEEKSFQSLQDNFVDLAEERDVPLLALASAAALVSYTENQTKSLSSLASMLRGEKEQNDLSKALRAFAQEEIGKRFLDSVTDYSLDIAQDRLSDIRRGLSKPSKRLDKITKGERVCIEKIIEELSTSPTDNLVFCSVGFPGNFISSQVLAKIRLSGGYDIDINDQMLRLSVDQDGVFDNATYSKFTSDFFVTRQINKESFAGFEVSPPISRNDIVNRMTLSGGSTGEDFINRNKNKSSIVRTALINEMTSYLMKKGLSLLSTVDMTEENLIKLDYEKRSPGAKSLAQKISEAAGLPKKTFDSVFSAADGITRLSETKMLKITVPSIKKTTDGQIFNPASINLGTAEMFYDIFNSPYFYDGLVRERVFSPTYFDKVVGVFFDSSVFAMKPDENVEIIKGGKKIDTKNQSALGKAASNSTQGTVSIMTYSVDADFISPAN